MRARVQRMLVMAYDPLTVRILLVALSLVLAATQAAQIGVEPVYACPSTGGGGCAGG